VTFAKNDLGGQMSKAIKTVSMYMLCGIYCHPQAKTAAGLSLRALI